MENSSTTELMTTTETQTDNISTIIISVIIASGVVAILLLICIVLLRKRYAVRIKGANVCIQADTSWTETRLSDPGYRRFILAGLAMDWMCVQLAPYLQHVIEGLHADLIANGHTRPTCHSNKNNYNVVKACIQPSCGASVRYLESNHKSKSIRQGWKNSHIERWESEAWALALLYMNPGQDPATNISPAHIDISGVLNLMTYCTRFNMNRTVINNIRKMRNTLVHHTSTFQVDKTYFDQLLDYIQQCLLDPTLTGQISADITNYIKSLKSYKLDITCNDEIKAFREMRREMDETQKQHLQEFIAGHKDLLSGLSEDVQHIRQTMKKVKTDIDQTKEDVHQVKHTVEQHATDFNTTKKDVQQVKNIVEQHATDFNTTKKDVQQVKHIVEQHATDFNTTKKDVQQVKNIVEQHATDFNTTKKDVQQVKHIVEQHATDFNTTKKDVQQVKYIVEQHATDFNTTKKDVQQVKHIVEQHATDIKQTKKNIHQVNHIVEQHATDINQTKEEVQKHEAAIIEMQTDMRQQIPTTVNKKLVQTLRQELIQCYSRPEFCHLNPLLDDDTLGHFIERVFEEVSLAEREVKPILGKRGLEDSMTQEGIPVHHVSDMIPSPDGQRVLLTGFVGSGKSSLCLHWIHEWSTTERDEKTLHKYQIVVFLRARALDTDVCQSLANVLEGNNPDAVQNKLMMIRDTFLLKPSTLIIIDGYDEATSIQQGIIDDIVSYKTFPHASAIITSRPICYQHDHIVKRYDNLGFNQKQQQSFIHRFKSTISEKHVDHFDQFEKNFFKNKSGANLFVSPMMAMTTCTMVAEGEDVDLESRIKIYEQVTDFLARKACYKHDIVQDNLTEALPSFYKATYIQMLEQNAFHFSREDILNQINPDTFDNVIVKLGYLSFTTYTLRGKKESAYAFVHKSWAEFTAARHVMNLPIDDRCIAVVNLFKSGPFNLEVLRFALGLCCQYDPEHLTLLVRTIGGTLKENLNFDNQDLREEMETFKLNKTVIAIGSAYLLLLLVEVVPEELPPAVVSDLYWFCASISFARIDELSLKDTVDGHIGMSAGQNAARALYTGLLLATHRAQDSLHTVREVTVCCVPHSPHSAVTRLPATLAACAPGMTALTRVDVWGLASSTELGDVCDGLAASGLHSLNSLELGGINDLWNVMGGEFSSIAQVIRTAAKLRELELRGIHCGEKKQLLALCAAVGEAPELTCLKLRWCSVSPQQYSAVLIPALRRRRTACVVRLGEVELGFGSVEEASEEERATLKEELDEVVTSVTVI